MTNILIDLKKIKILDLHEFIFLKQKQKQKVMLEKTRIQAQLSSCDERTSHKGYTR